MFIRYPQNTTNNRRMNFRRQRRFDRGRRGCYDALAGWSSLVARWAHNPKVGGSNPPPATKPSVWFQWVEPISKTGSVTLNPTSQLKFQEFFTHRFTQVPAETLTHVFLVPRAHPFTTADPRLKPTSISDARLESLLRLRTPALNLVRIDKFGVKCIVLSQRRRTGVAARRSCPL
jgi:hypothetical protein